MVSLMVFSTIQPPACRLKLIGPFDVCYRVPMECSPQKQNGRTLCFCFWGWIMWKKIIKQLLNSVFAWYHELSKPDAKSEPTTAAKHFLSSPNHTANEMQLIPIEKISSNRDSIGKAREAFLIQKGRTIGHFRVPLCLCFKASLSAKPFLWKWTLICMKMKLHAELIFIWKVSHLDSFWNRGTRELGNGLIPMVWTSAKKAFNCFPLLCEFII